MVATYHFLDGMGQILMNLKHYLQVREKIEHLRKEESKAEGAIEQLEREREEKYGVKSAQETKALLKKWEAKEKELQEELSSKWSSFQKKWKEVLDNEDEKTD